MADVVLAVATFNGPTSSGSNLDVTTTDLAGLVPKAVIIFGGASLPAGNDPDCRWSIGFATRSAGSPTVTTQNVHCADSENNVAATDVYSRWTAARVILATNSSVFESASVTAWITNGVRLNFATVTGGSRRYTAIFIGGSDAEVACGHVSPAGNVTVTPGFQADLVLLASSLMSAADNISSPTYGVSFGAAVRDGTQYCVTQGETDNISAGGRPVGSVRNDAALCKINPATGAETYRGAVGNFTATQFDLTMTGTPASDNVGWLAIRLGGGARAIIQAISAKTSTGQRSDSFGSPAFEPDFGLVCLSSNTAYNSPVSDSALAASIGLGAFSTTQAQTHNAFINPTADPTSTGNHSLNGAASLGSATAVDAVLASLVTLNTDGWTLDWTTVSGTAHVGFALGIGADFVPTMVPPRVTQYTALVGVKTENPVAPRVTQYTALVGIKTNKPPCDTAEADLWRIERTDGTVYCFTSHDRAMTFRGERYEPCGSLSASALQLSAELGSTDNVDLSGVIYEGGINELDLWSGRFVGAEVQIWRVSWDGTTAAVLVTSGVVGNTKFQDQPFTFEIVTAGERLTQRALLQPVMPTCRFKTFDDRCSLVAADFEVTGSVTATAGNNLFSGNARRAFFDSSRSEADGYFTRGKITWTSGDNNGQTADVKQYTQTDGAFILETRLQYPLQVGDTYTLLPGDDHTFETCRDKFNNAINFGGFHKVKGNDDLSKQGRGG